MRFLYKIHSGYDGFAPQRIPERLESEKRLKLGWKRYLDAVHIGDEVWVYFHGPHKFENGVYAKGIVQKIDHQHQTVFIRLRSSSVTDPLTDPATSQKVARAVAPRYLQVFLFPEEWVAVHACDMDATATSCQARRCEPCPTWQALPLIDPSDCDRPVRLHPEVRPVVAAYWVIPSRCFLHKKVGPSAYRTSHLFYRFKIGEKSLAYPLALGMYESLRKRKEIDFDCLVPIPLSPDKARAKEIHRTRLLANELSKLMGIDMLDCLSLTSPVSKRRLLHLGYSAAYFRDKYYGALSVRRRIISKKRVLLVDDVSTEGTTLDCAFRRIREAHPDAEVSAVTAGQMIMKAVVKDQKAVCS